MRLHRFAMLHLKPEPNWGPWKSYVGNSDHRVEIRRVPVNHLPRAPGVPTSSGWLVAAALDISGLPDLDEEKRVLIPLEARERCENAIESAANLVSVLEGCGRSILSPSPCLALEYESTVERQFLEASAGIKTEVLSSEAGVRLPIPRDDQSLLQTLSDRQNGVALLAEAYSGGGESSKYSNFIRFFELAFKMSPSKLGRKLTQFLAPSMGYTRQEVEEWLSLRNPHSHADFRESQFIAVASDVRTFLLRMEQACLDVLFNKAEWMRFSRTRRDVWFPDAISTSAAGNLVVKRGTALKLVFHTYDEFGVYPRDLGAALGSFPGRNFYSKLADESRQLPAK